MEFIPSTPIITLAPLRALGSEHLNLWVHGSCLLVEGIRGGFHYPGRSMPFFQSSKPVSTGTDEFIDPRISQIPQIMKLEAKEKYIFRQKG
jgi:hypothetical protein